MRHSVISVLLLTTVVLAVALPAAAQAESHALVEMYIDSPADTAFIQAHPGLDIAAAKPGHSVQLVATADDIDLLEREGQRYRILIDDLEAHYGARTRDVGFGIYHTYSEAVAFIDSLRLLYPEVISEKWSIGSGHEGRDLWCFRVSANPDIDEDEPEILLDGMHHAREIMASEFCLMFPEYLAQNYGSDPEVTWLLDNRELYVVPIVNPDGVVYNESIAPNGGGMWRKNRRDNGGGVYGVDPNRNYPYHWGEEGASPDPDDVTYRGPSAGSEPEVQAMMALINAHQFVTHQTVHTSGNLTLFPWGYTSGHTPDHDIFVHMGDVMTMYNGYAPGQTPDLLYPVSGITSDWSYGAQDEHDKIFCFSNELGGYSDGFWPPESRRQPLFEENIWPMTYLMQVAGSYATANDVLAQDEEGGQLDPGENGWLSFVVANPSVVADLDGLQLTLSSDDPYVQLTEAQRTIPGLPAMGSYDLASDPIPLVVAAACPDGHLVTVTVTMHLPEGDLYTSLGFMIGAPDLVFFDDFEGPGGTDAWQLTGNWGLTTASSHSPDHSLTDSPSGEYPDQSSTSATLAESYYATSLTFWHRYDIESGWDYGRVQVSADGGPWKTVIS
jgi:carboxypeptidase T